jgi:hypothetical protein
VNSPQRPARPQHWREFIDCDADAATIDRHRPRFFGKFSVANSPKRAIAAAS